MLEPNVRSQKPLPRQLMPKLATVEAKRKTDDEKCMLGLVGGMELNGGKMKRVEMRNRLFLL